MKEEKMFSILGLIDEDLIKEAEDKKALAPHKTMWKKRTVIAACLVFFTILAVKISFENRIMIKPNNEPSHTSLPVLPIGTNTFHIDGMGFEGHMAYDIKQLKNKNPWTEDLNIASLPVFKNTLNYDKKGRLLNKNVELMKKRLIEVCTSLGIDTKKAKIIDDYPNEGTIRELTKKYATLGEKVPNECFSINTVTIKDKEMEVSIDSNLIATISFKTPIALPKEYNFKNNASYEETLEVGKYLKREYGKLINMEDPKINVTGGDYNYDYSPCGFSIEFYNNNHNIDQKIINYNFHKVIFYPDDKGNVFLARIFKSDLSQKLGDYPIITPQKSKELLIKGNYISTMPEKFPGEKYIKKIELIYRTGKEEIYMPYYCIYVEMPNMKENNLNTYGTFYVPAVEEKYLSNMPVWDGCFNK